MLNTAGEDRQFSSEVDGRFSFRMRIEHWSDLRSLHSAKPTVKVGGQPINDKIIVRIQVTIDRTEVWCPSFRTPPPILGGVAAPLKKSCEATFEGAAGVVVHSR